MLASLLCEVCVVKQVCPGAYVCVCATACGCHAGSGGGLDRGKGAGMGRREERVCARSARVHLGRAGVCTERGCESALMGSTLFGRHADGSEVV